MENYLNNYNKNSNNKNISNTNCNNNQIVHISNYFNSNNVSDSVYSNINSFITPIRKSSYDPQKKVNMIQVASSSILPNDVKFLSHNNQTDKNVNSSIKSIVLPRIHTPSYKNNSHNLRDSNHYGQQVNHHSEMQSNFNNQRVIQKNIRRK